MSLLRDYYRGYASFKTSTTGIAWNKEREDKKKLLTQVFSKEMLRDANDEEFVTALTNALSSLWAMAVWTKREQRINQIIKRNGIKKLRDKFYDLIYGDSTLEKRFDDFLSSIWGIGAAAVTEILCFIEPKKYATWNKKVALAIEKLGLLEDLAKTLGFKKGKIAGISLINGNQYAKIIDFLNKLRIKLEQLANQKTDFLELDYFLYYIAMIAEMPTKKKKREIITKHEEAQYYLLKLGQLLGYVTHVARQDQGKIVNNEALGEIADVSELPQWLLYYSSIRNPEDIDVLWLDSAGEKPVYGFEVSHTTDITRDATALRDLALIMETVYIVAPDNRRNEFEKLKKSTQFRSLLNQGKLKFISYSELIKIHDRAKSLRELLDKIGIKILHFS